MLSIFLLVLGISVTSFAAPVLPSPDNIAARTIVESECTTRSLYHIIWGCLVTLFACSWSAYHPNVPRSDGGKDKFFGIDVPDSASGWHRPIWLCVSLIAPEAVVLIACDEYLKAKTLIMRSPVNHKITVVQAFFVLMRGFVKTDGQILAWNEIKDPEVCIRVAAVAPEDIKDKSKSDGLKKLLLTGQIVWFIVQFVARFSQGTNGTTHLEVLTVAIAALSCITSLFWWNKPLDVYRPFIVPPAPPKNDQETFETSSSDADVDDPVDIVPPERLKCRTDLCKGMLHPHAWISGLEQRIVKILSDDESDARFGLVSLALVATLFGGLHCLAWNYPFPTVAEIWMWRVLSVSIVVLVWLFALFAHLVDGNILSHDSVNYGVIPLYVVARLGLIALAFSSLRSLDPAVFCVVPWTTYIPHFD